MPTTAHKTIGDSSAASAQWLFSSRAASEGVADARETLFLPVPVVPWFDAGMVAEMCVRLQTPPMAKLLDLTLASAVDEALFHSIAAVWTAPASAVPRLGILLSFERWAVLRDAALAALQPLVKRGIRLQLLYAEQAWGGQLATWFRCGRTAHNVPAAIATLGRSWKPATDWPTVIENLAQLVHAHCYAFEVPALLTEVAELAASCGGDVQAELLAREALSYLREAVSVTGSKARRVLAAALMAQGQREAARALQSEAIAMAARVKAPGIEASALCQSGLSELNHGNYLAAEMRFRRAIDLLAPDRHMRAVAHHHLALALMLQGSREAEQHARMALALRNDPDTHFAEADRILLARLHANAHPRTNE